MAGFVCAQFSSGPRCRDNRIEKTDAEKKDCLKKAYMECVADVWSCRLDILDELPIRVSFVRNENTSKNTSSTLKPLDDLKCYAEIDDCLTKISACYCAGGMTGLTCAPCPDDLGGFGQEPDDEDVAPSTEEDEEVGETPPPARYEPITVSSTNGVIPVAFGRVILGGNIVWVSEPRKVSSSEARVDFALALCEGVVDRILRVWVGDSLVLDNTSVGATSSAQASDMGFTIELLSGTEFQKVHPLMVGTFGRNPAYRGLCLALVRDFEVIGTSSSLPAIRVEVTTKAVLSGVEWYDTSLDTASSNINSDAASKRLYLPASGVVELYRGDTVESISSRALDLYPDTLSLSVGEDASYQLTSDDLVFECAYNGEDTASISLAGQASLTRASRAPSLTQGDCKFVATLEGGDMRVYRAAEGATTLSLLSSLAHAGSFIWMSAADVKYSAESTPHRSFYVLSQVDGTLHLYENLLCASAGSDASASWQDTEIMLSDLGVSYSGVVESVTLLSESQSLILFLTEGSKHRVLSIDIAQPRVPLWSAEVEAIPAGSVQRLPRGDAMSYLAGGFLYSIDVTTGTVSRRTDIDVSAAPSAPGGQFYDSDIDSLLYITASGDLIKVNPGRVSDGIVYADEIIGALMDRAGIGYSLRDIDSLSTIPVDGFIIHDDVSLSDVLLDITTFYHWGVHESFRGIRVIPLGSASPYSLPEEAVTLYKRTRSSEVNDSIGFVRVGYYDSSTEFSQTYQEVTRDTLRGSSTEELGEGIYLSSSVFTSATTARLSAELALLRRIQRTRGYSGMSAPAGLLLEPLDVIILADGSTVRVNKTLLEPTEEVRFDGSSDDVSLYAEAPAVVGVDFSEEVAYADETPRVVNVPVVINLPPPQERGARERTWIGQVNPETSVLNSVFTPDALIVDNVKVTPPAGEALVGTFVSGLSIWRSTDFTTDYDNVCTIVFSKDIPAGTLSSATKLELLESYARNLLVVGGELLQFMTVSVALDNRTATFSGFLRGRFGTESKQLSHVAGERCAYYTPTSFGFHDARDADTGRVAVRLVSSDFTSVYRADFFNHETVLDEWLNLTVLAQAVPNGSSSSKVNFGIFPRVPATEFFTTTSQLDSLDEGSAFTAFLLESSFDRASFESAYLAGEDSWGASSYIRYAGTSSTTLSSIPMSVLITEGRVNNNVASTMYFTTDTPIVIVKGDRYKEAMAVLVPAGTRYHIRDPLNPTAYKYLFGRTQRG